MKINSITNLVQIRNPALKGWLILPFISLIASIFFILPYTVYVILNSILSKVSLSSFISLVSKNPSAFRNELDLIALYVLTFVFNIIALVVFLKKKKSAPNFVITVYILNLVDIIVLFNVSKSGAIIQGFDRTKYAQGFTLTFISSCIWCLYFLFSKRVKKTFVN